MNDPLVDVASTARMQPARRRFLRQAGGAALFAVVPFQPSAMAASSSYVASRFSLEVEGQPVSMLQSYEGGYPLADVVSEMATPGAFVKKHLAGLRYPDIVLQTGPAMAKPLYAWVVSTLNAAPTRKSGAIVMADFNNKESIRLQFKDALITEIGFPACDAASKDRAYLTIKLSPEMTQPLSGSGAAIKPSLDSKAKPALSSNFRLSIAGLDCSRVSRIDAFTIKQATPQDAAGAMREPTKEPGRLEFPNLAISIAESHAGEFYAWFNDMAIKGNSGDDSERSGKLELLSPNLKEVIFAINFQNLGICGYTPETVVANSTNIRRVRIDLYCERMML